MPTLLTNVTVQGINCGLIYSVRPADGPGAADMLLRAEETFLYLPFKGKLVATPDHLVLTREQEVAVQKLVAWLVQYAGLHGLTAARQREGWIVNLRHIAKYLEGLWMHSWQNRLYPDHLPPHLRNTPAERFLMQWALARDAGVENQIPCPMLQLRDLLAGDTSNPSVDIFFECMPERSPVSSTTHA